MIHVPTLVDTGGRKCLPHSVSIDEATQILVHTAVMTFWGCVSQYLILNVLILTPNALHHRTGLSKTSAGNVYKKTMGMQKQNNIPQRDKDTQRSLRRRSEYILEKQSCHGDTRRPDLRLSDDVGQPQIIRVVDGPWSPH